MTVPRHLRWFLFGAVLAAGLLSAPSLYAQLGCWGSICQDSSGRVFFSQPITARTPISLSTAPGAITMPGDLVLTCTRNPVVGPGLAALTLRVRPGTLPNTMKLVAIAGSAQVELVLHDNIPGGTC